MTDRFEVIDPQDDKLKEQLDKIEWSLYYGTVKVQIRQGKVTLITIERTIKRD